ncbi:MAG: NifB/NifX family molybdenum-iron cluster-binding protein [Melioribacteraceae bacterium]|nr:NifB/NifX family molybdenum-iron cluster-binding protein [Melioribacteraceae bacterium]
MLILIGSDGRNLEDKVAKRFGHSEFFILYNTETKTFGAHENIDEDHSHSNINDFIEDGVEVFIVGNIGPHSFKVINSRGSRIFLARNMSVGNAIDSYLNGGLKLLTQPTALKSIGHIHNSDH